jgi:hypothetical protein
VAYGGVDITRSTPPSLMSGAFALTEPLEVLGWELWVVDHAWGKHFNGPVPAPGLWCGGVPVKGHDIPVVYGVDGDADEAERQLANLDLSSEVLLEWLPHVRVNFTLGN